MFEKPVLIFVDMIQTYHAKTAIVTFRGKYHMLLNHF